MNAPLPSPPPVKTTCPYCGVGCGVAVVPDAAGGAHVEGDKAHPANFGRLCSKGAALGETLGLETRLLYPMMRTGDGPLARTSWDVALDRVARDLAAVIDSHGPGSAAFYLSGQLLTEDYYVANKLAKGFLGTAHVDTNSRLCMASSVAGHKRAFGSDTVPGCYADLEAADLIVLVGSNAAFCHPVLFRRMEAARAKRGTKIVVIDPRGTETAAEADMVLPLAHGTDAILFSGLLVYLADAGRLDAAFLGRHTQGFAEALAAARAIAPDAAATARACGLGAADVAAFFALFAATGKVVTGYSQGVNQSAQGTDKVGAIVNCHLATGRIGREGMGPFSLTGQPNAMGGREVGGLANQLAAHMGFSPAEVDRVRRFWSAPRMAEREGLKAVDMFAAIGAGEIKALWVMGTNPAVSLPQTGAVRAALEKLDLFVLSENVAANDTAACRPHVMLPAAAWGEKDGTVTNSERRISRQRAFLPLPGEVKHGWWPLAEVARRLGFADAFAWTSAAAIFREHAALSGFENDGARDFDISGLATLSDAAYDALQPVQWPVPKDAGAGAGAGATPGTARLFADGGFFTADRRARFIVPAPVAPPLGAEGFPLLLNTGRLRDQWHTMTRTGLSPRLAAHEPVPFVAVHPDDAARLGLAHGGLARVTSAQGATVLEVRADPRQPPGTAFAPIHWSFANASHGPIGQLVQARTDPLSGQPDSKATPVALAPEPAPFEGVLLARQGLTLPDGAWWARAALSGGFGWRLAGTLAPQAWAAWFAGLGSSDIIEMSDPAGGAYRAAAFDAAGRLVAALFVAPAGARPNVDALKGLLGADPVAPDDRRVLLAGRRAGREAAGGPLVCACFGVSQGEIAAAIGAGCADIAAVGRALRAGTNCGSCVPEIRTLLSRASLEAPAPRPKADVAA
ncbi:molybdopterin-dependent oxidoreductase [Xanthobacter tagetidis]|uniref:Nitrate reductase n=1 Tax=Xanthobacter tagetidis TaxID=60216 RepID=A0A3L7AI39_9HYPH|nr:molybdopterin-dependent oxidoreductase [Xanthobacter tagetidis]MBB6306987.1 assimilatory nitrate reductase catalytic subunit [Xanthobacter tagetidis]RLP80166.1 nitrate reductase [Xanthobacter tagetidis]